MSRTTTSDEPRKVASARDDPGGTSEEHANATGAGVLPAGSWVGGALGVGAIVGAGELCGLTDGAVDGDG